MIEGFGEQSVKQNLIDKTTFDKGIRGLYIAQQNRMESSVIHSKDSEQSNKELS